MLFHVTMIEVNQNFELKILKNGAKKTAKILTVKTRIFILQFDLGNARLN